MRVSVILGLFVPLSVFGLSASCTEAAENATFFSVTGDVTVSVDAATASMLKIRNRIPAITITSAPSSIKKLGQSYSVNLFFSSDFDPKPGTYPVAFSYRSQPNTLGGSFLKRGSMFSHDTKGTAEFVEFGEQVKVRFEFQVSDRSEGSEERKTVTVKGEAVCERADIF
ncbi:MAG: hypothetical protein GY906_00240 [bacterium]|nr:hypothetical protein [bacterium]